MFKPWHYVNITQVKKKQRVDLEVKTPNLIETASSGL